MDEVKKPMGFFERDANEFILLQSAVTIAIASIALRTYGDYQAPHNSLYTWLIIFLILASLIGSYGIYTFFTGRMNWLVEVISVGILLITHLLSYQAVVANYKTTYDWIVLNKPFPEDSQWQWSFLITLFIIIPTFYPDENHKYSIHLKTNSNGYIENVAQKNEKIK
jgi:hypothetical protein